MMLLLLGTLVEILLWACGAGVASADIIGIPTAPYTATGSGNLAVAAIESIVVDSKYYNSVDRRGSTLIPPTLHQFAATFAEDLRTTFDINVTVKTANEGTANSVFLTIGQSQDYVDAAGSETSEGYSLAVDSTGITITGASSLGAWWGTRTLLQQAILNNGTIPHGSGLDSPGWGTRGMMLDAGRHFYPMEFLVEMCAYMSFFKQNTFHLHLSDNLYNNPVYSQGRSLELYARFRLWSDSPAVAGLNKYRNESYTREEFEEIQFACAARGVTILPEIEAPGHALVIVQWKPEIGYGTDLSLLNISHPETMPAMKAIWGTFLDWFHCKVVSIGADEYTGAAREYNSFVNAMNSFIGERSGKSIRIWGTFPPRPSYDNIDQNVSVQHWALFEDNPYFDYIQNNYSVVNSLDDFYIVNKYGGYPNSINHNKIFHGNPDRGSWRPHIFDTRNATKNPPSSSRLVLGAITPLWNDYGANATVYSEAYYAWRQSLPALADKQWGGNLSEADYARVFPSLQPRIPGQNLDRAIPSKTDTIFNYTLQDMPQSPSPTLVKDASPNGYDAHTDCPMSGSELSISPSCSVTTPLSSKGRNYTLSLSIMVTELAYETNATLIFGGDSSLMLTPDLTLFASGNYYSLNSALPMDEWVELTISGRGNQTFATISSASEGEVTEVTQEFQTKIGINGQSFHWAEMAIEAPLHRVGGNDCGWSGKLRGMSLTGSAGIGGLLPIESDGGDPFRR